ncbi:hypothetical protein IEQ34_018777 [Dendrobium chrysotoxum]|uniref:BHLH domain-containing protein n=1 Tax=Dendrobium chrysotoxum TaxID=161865 RepID=A0AAV7G6S2_DENCH|nr:hypothetical protein IEQ34_018777 [Dendrobium chrysotoxum]
MSRRRSRSRQTSSISSRISVNQVNHLISRLQNLVPEARIYATGSRASSAIELQEVCNYIRCLHEEIDCLSQRLSELLPTADSSTAALAVIIRINMEKIHDNFGVFHRTPHIDSLDHERVACTSDLYIALNF